MNRLWKKCSTISRAQILDFGENLVWALVGLQALLMLVASPICFLLYLAHGFGVTIVPESR